MSLGRLRLAEPLRTLARIDDCLEYENNEEETPVACYLAEISKRLEALTLAVLIAADIRETEVSTAGWEAAEADERIAEENRR